MGIKPTVEVIMTSKKDSKKTKLAKCYGCVTNNWACINNKKRMCMQIYYAFFSML